MPTQRLSMRRIRDVLRLRHQGLTERVIARMIGVSNGVVHGYQRRARLAGLTWPLPDGLDDEGLELLLFPAPTAASQSDRRPAPDWIYVEKELRRRSVTRLLLWEEYRAANPDGFGYTWFCTTFEDWEKRARPTMRQTHLGGEKVFVDFAGDTIDIFDPITGEAHAMKLFVAAMGASNYTYAEACPSQRLPDWISMHIKLFRFLGGVPKFVVCDNLKAAVTNPDRYDPGLNRTYAEMASHDCTAILAARPRARRTRQRLRSPSRSRSAGSWRGCAISGSFPWQSSMPPLACLSSSSTPARCAVSAPAAPNSSPRSTSLSWENCRTSHMSLRAGSVAASRPTIMSRSTAIGIPPLIGSSVNSSMCASLTRRSRSSTRARGSRATPARPIGAATPRLPITCQARIAATAGGRREDSSQPAIGSDPLRLPFSRLSSRARPHPEQGFRTCLGILSLARSYDNARVDAACRRGILIKARSVASIRSILKNGLDRAFLDEHPTTNPCATATSAARAISTEPWRYQC